MADTVEVVIRINKADYDNLMNNWYKETMWTKAIRNGIVLPKGHGRLIDADAITKDFNTFQDSFVINMTDFGQGKTSIICLAPTVIAADNGKAATLSTLPKGLSFSDKLPNVIYKVDKGE